MSSIELGLREQLGMVFLRTHGITLLQHTQFSRIPNERPYMLAESSTRLDFQKGEGSTTRFLLGKNVQHSLGEKVVMLLDLASSYPREQQRAENLGRSSGLYPFPDDEKLRVVLPENSIWLDALEVLQSAFAIKLSTIDT